MSVPAGSLVLTGDGTLKGAFGQDAVLTHGAYAFPQHLVNTPPPLPHITGIRRSSRRPMPRFYAAPGRGADRIELRRDVQRAGDLRRDQLGAPADFGLKVLIGETEKVAAEYQLGSGTSKLLGSSTRCCRATRTGTA